MKIKKGISLSITTVVLFSLGVIILISVGALFLRTISEGESDIEHQREHSYVVRKLIDCDCCYIWDSTCGLNCDEIVDLHPDDISVDEAQREVCGGLVPEDPEHIMVEDFECRMFHPTGKGGTLESLVYIELIFYLRNYESPTASKVGLEFEDGTVNDSVVKFISSDSVIDFRLNNMETDPSITSPYPDTEWGPDDLTEHIKVKGYKVSSDGEEEMTHQNTFSICEECEFDIIDDQMPEYC